MKKKKVSTSMSGLDVIIMSKIIPDKINQPMNEAWDKSNEPFKESKLIVVFDKIFPLILRFLWLKYQ